MFLTVQGGILKPFAVILGYIMEGIFWLLDKITGGNPNTGLTIIIFTIVVYVLMLPLTIKQQKFSKLSAKMNPELQVIQNKYKGKSDQDSMMKMQQETQMVYTKYGVSPSGSCLQLLIQMPILFALYRVIYNMPAYVGKIRDAFEPLVTNLVAKEGSTEFIQSLSSAAYYSKQFKNEFFGATTIESGLEYTKNTFIDVLNRASTAEWMSVTEKYGDLTADVNNTLTLLDKYNNFMGLNIANSPSYTISAEWAADEKNWAVIIGVLLIPVLSALTQWINTKLMPQQESNKKNDVEENPMVQSMKMMNTFMPFMSAFFCYTMPVGMGIYWISGSVVRSIIQICINKHLDKIDIDEMIKKNIEKNNEKRKKAGLPPQQINANATLNTKAIDKPAKKKIDNAAQIKESEEYYKRTATAKEGSLASKAFMVKQFNEKNNKEDNKK